MKQLNSISEPLKLSEGHDHNLLNDLETETVTADFKNRINQRIIAERE